MALLVCVDCTARFSVGAPRCPQCQSTNYVEEGAEDMPKVTVHGGPSVADGGTVVEGEHGPELVPVTKATAEDTEGSEASSPGTSSSTSSEKQQPSDEPSSSGGRSPARTTASRSKKGQTGSSSARTTGGGQTGRTSASADDD
ncbi:hypothetical protein AB0E27_20050 [Streptomyces sparsogenes]|uniref:hypothetical protein n=1 Tax=Streptomyces sparsogenes TaxID=67365 RepID=UPI0033FF059A